MPDWNDPTITRRYDTEFTQDLKALRDSQAKLFDDGVSWSNLPSGTIRYSTSNKRFEKWNGSAWAAITEWAIPTITSCGQITNTGTMNIGPSTNHDLRFDSNGATRFVVDASRLYPNQHDTYDIGTASLRIRDAHIANVKNVGTLINGNTMTIGPTNSNDLNFQTNGSWKQKIAAAGHLLPNGDDTYNLGAAFGSGRYLSVYAAALRDCANLINGNDMTIGPSSAHVLNLRTNDLVRFYVDATGNLSGDGTNSGNIVFLKAGTGIVNAVDTGVTATGSDQAGALAITKHVTVISGGAADTGVRLFAPAAGSQSFTIYNDSGSNKKVYPPSGAAFFDNPANAAITLGNNTAALFSIISATKWAYFAGP